VSQNAAALLATSRGVLGEGLTRKLVKSTFFAHFCAGEDAVTIRPTIAKLREAGVGGILDYAAEADLTDTAAEDVGEATSSLERPQQARAYDYESELQCDKHVDIFLNCIDAVSAATPDGFAAIKLTALGNPALLKRMSTCIVELRRLFEKFDANGDGVVSRAEFEAAYDEYFAAQPGDTETTPFSKAALMKEFEVDGGVDYLEWTIRLRLEDLPTLTERCHTRGPLYDAALRGEEGLLLAALRQRVETLAAYAETKGVRLMIDAEQTYFQPAIDNCVLDLQQRFNGKRDAAGTPKAPVIFNTYQCYLKATPEALAQDLERADRLDYNFAAKLVRGAYMYTERELAADMGYPSPVHDTIQDTHDCYNGCVAMVLDAIAGGKGAELMVASHNQDSVERTLAGVKARGIADGKDNRNIGVYFGQLLGMADHLSFGLGGQGYAAYKYVPFGDVDEVMPYLIRRAQENSDFLGGVGKEIKLIQTELVRRIRG